jgi:hypothetical protein
MSQNKSTEKVTLAIDKETLLDILKHAAGRERTIVEFQTNVVDGERQLDTVLEITDHVNELESDI